MDEFSQNYNNGQVEYLDGEQLVKTIRRKRKVRKGRKRQNAFRALLCFVTNIVLIFGICRKVRSRRSMGILWKL